MLINPTAVIDRILPHIGPEYLFLRDMLSNVELTQIPWWIGAGGNLKSAVNLMRQEKSYDDYAEVRRRGRNLSVIARSFGR